MDKIYCIHDKAFKTTMSDIRVARDFFQEYLPESVLAIVNLNTLKLSKNSFVDEDLKEFSSDILYEVMLKNSKSRNINTGKPKMREQPSPFIFYNGQKGHPKNKSLTNVQ